MYIFHRSLPQTSGGIENTEDEYVRLSSNSGVLSSINQPWSSIQAF